MAIEVIVTDEFAAWYEELAEAEQESVGRVVALLEERGATLGFPMSSGIKGTADQVCLRKGTTSVVPRRCLKSMGLQPPRYAWRT